MQNSAATAAPSDLSTLHPLGSSVTTTVHSIGGRSEKVTGEVVKHRRNAVDVRTANHGTIVVPRSQIENRRPR